MVHHTKKTFQVNPLFTDHMVLQRGKRVRVFGGGTDCGDKVHVVFDGKRFDGIAGEDEWEVWLDAMQEVFQRQNAYGISW